MPKLSEKATINYSEIADTDSFPVLVGTTPVLRRIAANHLKALILGALGVNIGGTDDTSILTVAGVQELKNKTLTNPTSNDGTFTDAVLIDPLFAESGGGPQNDIDTVIENKLAAQEYATQTGVETLTGKTIDTGVLKDCTIQKAGSPNDGDDLDTVIQSIQSDITAMTTILTDIPYNAWFKESAGGDGTMTISTETILTEVGLSNVDYYIDAVSVNVEASLLGTDEYTVLAPGKSGDPSGTPIVTIKMLTGTEYLSSVEISNLDTAKDYSATVNFKVVKK